MMRVLLVGNPNVGKSAIFSHLTGLDVTTSNYPGTTVEFAKGNMTYENQRLEIIDVPGTYDLEPHCRAEKVAVDMIPGGDVLVNVVDATNLERNLNLTLQLRSLGKPMVMALNMWDETRHKGIAIDAARLEGLLGIPVVTTSGQTGEGLIELRRSFMAAEQARFPPMTAEQRWGEIGAVIREVQNLSNRRHTFMERMQDLSVHPLLGFPAAVLALAAAFRIIIGLGGAVSGLLNRLFLPVILPVYLLAERLAGRAVPPARHSPRGAGPGPD